MAVQPIMNSWQVGVAAEAAVASLFARVGMDVSVQYGANQPEYDLIVARGEQMLKISVKGSKDGGWGLTQSHLKNADYHGAIDIWLARHKKRTVFALVQFQGVEIDAMPRVYLATPLEIANLLKSSAGGRGETVLRERHVWGPRARGAGTIDEIPARWRFSVGRIDQLMQDATL